jgi:DNA-binding PucR family transcriptional regulator
MSAALDRAFAEMPARAAAALRIAMQPDIEAARRDPRLAAKAPDLDAEFRALRTMPGRSLHGAIAALAAREAIAGEE